VRNGNLLKSHVSEICIKQIRFNQRVGVNSKKKSTSELLGNLNCHSSTTVST
jgi:hypothetical protein